MDCAVEEILETADRQVYEVALADRVNKIEKDIGAIGKELHSLKTSLKAQPQDDGGNLASRPTAPQPEPVRWWKSSGRWGALGSCVAVPLAIIVPLSLRSCDKNDQKEKLLRTAEISQGIKDSGLPSKIDDFGIRLGTAEGSIKELNQLLPSFLEERWKRGWSAQPQNLKQSIPEIKAIVAASQRLKVESVPVQTVSKVGNGLLPLAADVPEAWSTLLDVASYRSSLNLASRPNYSSEPISVPSGTVWHYNLPPPDVHPRLKFSGTFLVPESEAARLDNIGTDQNKNSKLAPGWLFADGGILNIDGLEIRNVALTGVEVHYSGKSVVLKNVIFIGCTFVFENDNRTRLLAAQILGPPTVTFKAG
jgi:hypothetical protein